MGSSTSMSIGSVWVFDASKMDSTSVSSSLLTELSSGTPLPQFTMLLNDISNLLRFCSGSKRSCDERQLKKEIDHGVSTWHVNRYVHCNIRHLQRQIGALIARSLISLHKGSTT